MATCQFCEHIDSRFIICEGKYVFATLDLNPINRYHTLIIPRQHFESFISLPDEVAGEIFLMARAISQTMREVAKPDAISHLSDDDISGGFNLVGHYKFHIIPRYKGDQVQIEWGRSEPPSQKERLQWVAQLKNDFE